MCRKLLLSVVVLLFSSLEIYAQLPAIHPRLPYLLTRNPRKLAIRLTSGLKEDKDKIRVIHSWITHNIKYDVKKASQFNYSTVSAKKVLRKRKAICKGYSDLFNELCRYSGVKSVEILGYIKNKRLDITDDFYLESHSWNAAMSDGKWILIDACWDAGYIAFTKRTLKGHFVHLVSGGKKDIKKYKPHFVRYPTETYFAKSRNSFRYDHLPADPIWSIDQQISINEFKTDSSYYFKHIEEEFRIKKDAFENSRNQYFLLDENERVAEFGIRSYGYNNRNPFGMARGNYKKAEKLRIGLDPLSPDTSSSFRTCDSALTNVLIAKAFCDSTLLSLKKEKDELFARNKEKKRICSNHYRTLSSSTRFVLKNLEAGIGATKRSQKQVAILLKSAKKKINTLHRNTIELSNSKNKPKLDELLKKLEWANDSIQKKYRKLTNALEKLHLLNLKGLERANLYSEKESTIISIANLLGDLRLECNDDLDYEIRSIKDSLIKKKLVNDTVLFIKGRFITSVYSDQFKSVKTATSEWLMYQKLKSKTLRSISKFVQDSLNVPAEINHQRFALDSMYSYLSKAMTLEKSRLKKVKQYCKKQGKLTKEELIAYNSEMSIENFMYKERGAYIKGRNRSLVRACAIVRKAARNEEKLINRFRKDKRKELKSMLAKSGKSTL